MFTQLFTILPLTSAIFVLLFGFFVLSKDIKSRINQLLFAFCLAMFFWLFGTFMMFGTRVTDVAEAIFWDRFVYIGVVFMPSLMHHFSLIFTNRKNQRKLLKINYFFSFVFLLASRTAYFVNDLFIYSWGAHTKAQILHDIFLVYFFLGTSVFFYNIFSYYTKLKEKILRSQALYVFISFAMVIFVGGVAYLYAYGIDTKFPFAYFSGVIFPVMLFYSVTKHHLLGAKMIGAEVLVGITNFIIVTEIFLSRSIQELLLKVFFAFVIVLMSVLLIKSIRKEMMRKEELAKLAASLEKANLRLQELDKQKTEFLSIASHQLRTPMSIIKGYIELIQDGAYGKITKETFKILADMDETNERLVKLIDEFLDVSRIEQGRTKFTFEKKNMNELINSVVKELNQRALDKGLKIEWKPGKGKEEIVLDKEKVRHVIFNFIDNAIKYSMEGTIRVLLEREKNGMIVRVKDNGIGFNKMDEANFFQKFYRGRNVKMTKVGGIGLGIYVTKQFIEKHGGEVWAKSEGLGKGGEFGFWIPMNKQKLKEQEAEEKPAKEDLKFAMPAGR